MKRITILPFAVCLTLMLVIVPIPIIFYFVQNSIYKCDDSLCIAIDNGKILGSYVNGYEKKVVKQFLGIPYGVAPINDLRFEKPKPYKEKYKSGIFKAMEYGPSCPQVIDKTYRNFSGSTMWNAPNKQSEDCLNLNIWVPHNDTRIYTVMVWIFGGGFTSGTSALSIYNGKYLASQGNVLVVSFNYRIGALGFLKNDKLGLKGNYGLYDQILLLKWIKKNIDKFGGNPDSITLFGESSGGASINYLMNSPISSHLFKRVILQSGVADTYWSYMTINQAEQRFTRFLRNLKQINANAQLFENKDVIKYIKECNVKDILSSQYSTKSAVMIFPWVPSTDGELIKMHIHDFNYYNETTDISEKTSNNSIPSHDVMLGYNENEGTYWLIYALSKLLLSENMVYPKIFFEKDLNFLLKDIPRKYKSKINFYYNYDEKKDYSFSQKIKLLDKLLGDFAFICPTINFARKLESKYKSTKNVQNVILLYVLKYRARNEPWPSWLGVIHGSDIQWIFGNPLDTRSNYTKQEKELAIKMITIWSDFAKNGSSELDPNWHSFKKNDCLEISETGELKYTTIDKDDICTLWDRIRDQTKYVYIN